MSRYTGPTSRINRRFAAPIFNHTKACDRKAYYPGQHGPRLRRKQSEYSIGLNEKQKLRFMYGLTEKQFRRTFGHAKVMKGVTGHLFLFLLESRLDNVVYRLGFANSRAGARQFVNHGHIAVNGQKVDIASFTVSPGDVISVRERASARALATSFLENVQADPMPWISVSSDSLSGTFNRLPEFDEIPLDINIQIIVEFYSR